MNERWVCKRCFADNDETDSACRRCGLVRGSESTQADQTTWLEAIFFEICEPSFAGYVGEPWQTSAIYGSMISASEESWGAGDREFVCVLYDPDDTQLTESLRGANP
jgi:putative regulator of septum formation